jgi:hypothetical protein
VARVSIIIDTTEEGVVDGPADKVARKFVDGGEADKAVSRFSSSAVSSCRELKLVSSLRRGTCVAGGRGTLGSGGDAHEADGRGPAGVE